MDINISIKKSWYGLILLVSVVPALLIFIWSGNLYYRLLIEKHLEEQEFLGELAVDHLKQEVIRLGTLLENKSDPIAYTLARDVDAQLLDELLYKVISREPAVHMLVVISADGQVIAGMETYDDYSTPMKDRLGLPAHWNYTADDLPDIATEALQGRAYCSPVNLHPEGAFFSLSVPVGPVDRPQAALLAYVDASMLWKDLQHHLHKEEVDTYLIDSAGRLLSAQEKYVYIIGDSLIHLPVVSAYIDKQKWKHGQTYLGLMGKQVYGSISRVDSVGIGVVTEIEREHVMRSIRSMFYKLAVVGSTVILLLLLFGMRMIKPVVKSIDLIATDFKRVARQDYQPSEISSPFVELQSLVEGFNIMVREIDHNLNDLRQAAVVFDNTSEGIIITDAEHRIISVNRAFTEITGYSKGEVMGKNPSLLKSGQHDASFYADMWNSINTIGKWRGEIWNRRKTGEIFTDLLSINTFRDIHESFTYHIGVFSDISSIKETEYKLEHLAHHDPLTDLPNRILCQARMEHELSCARRSNQQVAVLFLDLDMFKNVNDSLGHEKGDNLLQQVAKRISDRLRDKDTIARLGGDEFVIIVGSLKSRQDAALVCENILSHFSTPFFIDEQEVFIGASIGISIFPDDGEDTNILLRNADSAMYRAKSEGRNNYEFYMPALTKEALERLSMETSLRQALEKNELCLYYQPQYSLKSENIIGVEALLRWQHPEKGLVTPDRFITLAEETGLIVPIGEWVLKTACEQQVKWVDAGHSSIRMAVNLSARQFNKPGLDKVIEDVLKSTGIKSLDLELELTESIIMHDNMIVSDTLNALHEMGIGLSIDDFGTGYSSLSYIRRFNLDRIKIDRSFVEHIMTNSNDAEMIVSIIALAHSMKLQVLAEGVETREQLLYLQEKGCDEVQGYYFSAPVTAGEFERLLNGYHDYVSRKSRREV